MSLREHIRSLGRRLSTAQKTDLLVRRQRLEARITTFDQRMSTLLNVSDNTQWSSQAGKLRAAEDSADELSDCDSATPADMDLTPELYLLSLPSSLAPGEIARNSLESFATIEAELRRGQINDALHELRLALGEKSLSFRAEVRNANSQRTSLRAWSNVHKHDSNARRQRKRYQWARIALIRLGLLPEFLATLHDISEQDLKMSGDLTEENRYGQRSETLPWFWRLGDSITGGTGSCPRMRECEYQSRRCNPRSFCK